MLLDTEIFLDWIYWSRQIVGLLFGLIWGVIPLTGLIGLIAFGKKKSKKKN